MDKPVAVVSGGAQGIGFATVRLLAQRGFQVLALDIRQEVEHAARSLRDEGLSVEGRVADVTDRSAIVGALKDHLKINTVVCAAGIIVYKPFEEVAEEDFRRIFNVNVMGVFLLAQEGLKRMDRGGRIIMISSRGVLDDRNTSPYIASKSAVVGLVRALAAELRERGIIVNVVAPGFTETPMVKIFPKDVYEAASKREPRGHAADPSEIAPAIAFLTSPEAASITGQTLFVDGGKSLGGLGNAV
ncbi:MAG TPA: SDR family oxidoreductase [Rhizomicrobium sp.]|jgi:3-oxoacyl-[acyl-carrier protein] reductase|nr:SDR family oxidoreductase [Rhizomicrobium sp.]